MKRNLILAAGLFIVVASGAAYGVWTQRWQKSADLEVRAAKLKELPDDLGRWKSEPAEVESDALAMAGAEGWWVRRFTDERTGTSLLVILLCGRPGPLSVHPPDACYGGAGYALEAPPIKYTPRAGPTAPPAGVWTGKFKQPEAGRRQLRIF